MKTSKLDNLLDLILEKSGPSKNWINMTKELLKTDNDKIIFSRWHKLETEEERKKARQEADAFYNKKIENLIYNSVILFSEYSKNYLNLKSSFKKIKDEKIYIITYLKDNKEIYIINIDYSLLSKDKRNNLKLTTYELIEEKDLFGKIIKTIKQEIFNNDNINLKDIQDPSNYFLKSIFKRG